ncbi:GH3 auxin-responsive promoter [Clostridium ljungdahlii DSM 13528]|uniref:GH3 auxin-responsive promoter n=2 Tax=Clostridium TaxID=1485 RepID=D8GI74_CLOLD|nr:plant auxin-responsive GH3-like protein [Clostridium ljungdahlii DSM 13528]OAA87931.1 GH3 auxin-responsive promoter [Clostridium ljungdahlii DSM 13528]OAA94046.1 GH3 auxin-responsive promoter [Clostridium coskatii]OBR96608.1 GH3 auxin-responsive promoter [Clostridium coskatii]
MNEKVLFKILKSNAKSEIGIKFNFKDIKSIDDFKKQVPLTQYGYYESYIERMANGQKNILTSDNVEYFGHTSGTTGKQKLIPCTKRGRKIASKYMALLINKYSYDNFKENWNYGKGLMIADIVMTTYTKGGIPICSATSGGMNGIKYILPYLYTSPLEVMTIKDREDALYLHLLFALEEVKLLYISGVFISNILDLFRVLESKYESLVRDIRRGCIRSSLNIDENTRINLNKHLSPNASRADQLEREFKKGFKGISVRIWPNMAYIATVTGANFSIYDDKVNYYTNSLPIYSPGYAATEAMIGINPYVNKIRYVIIPDTVFYEFIPIKEKNKKSEDTFCLDELEIGEKYEIVITNYAGLYRYRMGDVIKVVDFYNNCPEIEFLYRKNQVLNMAAEKTNEEQLTNAIRNTMKKLDLNLVDYTTIPDNSITPGRYSFYFEFKNNIPNYKVKLLEETLDYEIRKSNLAYDRARNNKRLGRVKVMLLAPNTFNLVKESLFNKGVSKNQIKIPRVAINNRNILNIVNKSKIL